MAVIIQEACMNARHFFFLAQMLGRDTFLQKT
jgi:hypothetical protein